MTRLGKQRDMYEWWVKGLGPKGVPAYAIEQSLPYINQRANTHLRILADGDIEVTWSATTEGSTGVTKEELTQNVIVEGIVGAKPSGGQSKKIELATEVALAEVMRESEGVDYEGQQRVCEWLDTLPQDNILVVSHDTEIGAGFDTELWVTKQDGAGTIRVD